MHHLGYNVEHFRDRDPEGFINGTPRSNDLDVFTQNATTIVNEIKANASGADVTEFARSVTLYERQTGKTVNQKILFAVTIKRQAIEQAKELGIVVTIGFYDF